MADQDEIIETTTEPEALAVEEGVEAKEDGTLETTYGALPVDDSFSSDNIPFVANAPLSASRLSSSFGSIPFGATTQGFSSGFSSQGYTSGYKSGYNSGFSSRGYTSGYNSGFTSTMASSNVRSSKIPFQANTGSYSGFGANTRGVTSGYTSGCSGFGANTRGFSSNASSYTIPFKASPIPFKANTPSYSASPVTSASPATIPFQANTGSYSGFGANTGGFTSTMASSNSRSATIPFQANTGGYSASPVTSAYSTMPTTSTLGSSYATPMKASGPPTGNGAGASAFRNITAQRDSQLRTKIDNAITLHP